MASLRDPEFNVESEAAILPERAKRVYVRLKERMMVCSVASIKPIERWER